VASKEYVELELRQLATISGSVLLESEPFPSATVTATSSAGTSTALTDGAGHFRLVGLREGEYEVRARASNLLWSALARTKVSDSQDAKLDLRLVERSRFAAA